VTLNQLLRAKSFVIVALLLSGLSIGALLGQHWRGSIADWTLLGLAIVTLALLAVNAIGVLASRERLSIGDHFVLARQEDRWVLRLQNVWRLLFIEIDVTLPQGLRSRLPATPVEPEATADLGAPESIALEHPALADGRRDSMLRATAERVIPSDARNPGVGARAFSPKRLAMTWAEQSLLRRQPLHALVLAGAVGLGLWILALLIPLLMNAPADQWSSVWQMVQALRSLIRSNHGALSVLLIGGASAMTFLWWRREGAAGLWRGVFALSLALVFAGEMIVLDKNFALGAGLYLAGGIVLVVQTRLSRDQAGAALESATMPWKKELLAFGLVFAVVLVTHFYLLGRAPYGVEGDESSWALRVADALNRTEPQMPYPFAQMPTTFWVQSASYQLFGMSIESARLGVALLSLVGTVLFYLAVREMINVPVALIATYLLGVSLIDLAASRQAHVETYVKVWIMAAVFGVFLGYRKRQPLLFLLAGIALALGYMTYDSFALTPPALFAYALYRLFRERQSWRRHLLYIGALLVPVLVVAPGVWTYLEGRRISQVAILSFETGVYPDSLDKIVPFLPQAFGFALKYAGVTLGRLTYQQLGDVLISRPGPLESAAFIPLVFLGLILAAAYWRRRHSVFPLLWVLIPALPTSLILGQAFARTYYPFLGGLVILAAIALWVPYRALRQHLATRARRLLMAGWLLCLGLLGLSNAYVYFNEVLDPVERQVRREFGDLLRSNVGQAQMVYLPYLPLQNDFLEYEWRYARYAVSARVPRGAENQFYRSIPYPDMLRTIARQGQGAVKVFYDKTITAPAQRQPALEVFKRCYPTHAIQTGRFFDVYTVSPQGLAQAACYADAEIALTSPPMNQTLPANQGVNFAWETSKGQQTTFWLTVEKHNDRIIWLEAEDFSHGQGWEAQAHLASGYSGSAYLADLGQDDTNVARQSIDVPEAGRYRVWARSYRRRDDGGPVFLDVAGHHQEIARALPAALNRWQWESLGEYDLSRGKQVLTLARRYAGDSPWQIFIDAIVLARQEDFDPNVQSAWETVIDTSEVQSSERAFRYAQPLAPGNYRWRVQVFDSQRLVEWNGSLGVTSADSHFRVSE